MCRIIRLSMCLFNVYVVRDENAFVLVDTGVAPSLPLLRAGLRRHGIRPGSITLIILTHCHYDHAGGVRWMKQHSGAQVLVHAGEAAYLQAGRMPLPPGTAAVSRRVVHTATTLFPCAGGYDAADPDLLVDGQYDLAPHGLPALVLPTPGHTAGSLSVVIGRQAIVGDLMYNRGPVSVFPPFAADEQAVMSSWVELLRMGCREFFPGHGRPIGARRLRRDLALCRSRRLAS